MNALGGEANQLEGDVTLGDVGGFHLLPLLVPRFAFLELYFVSLLEKCHMLA